MAASDLAQRHQRQRQALVEAAARATSAQWSQVDPTAIANSWTAQLPGAVAVVSGGQLAAAKQADPYLADMATAEDVTAAAAGSVLPSSLTGVASDGRDLMSLLYQPAIAALLAIKAGAATRQAMAIGGASLDLIVRTQVADAGRVADGVSLTANRGFPGYVRRLTPPSCARCAILAGRFYKWNAGFKRHPRCDCVHVPTIRASADSLLFDTRHYFRSLSHAEQDRIFTKAGAEAIRDGADINRVVNARRGMSTASFGGRTVRTTTEATTGRGINRSVRLMPEEIYRLTDDRDEAIRLLRLHGYLF